MDQGTIALDIDGTITDARHSLSDEVALYFHALYRLGWKFIFITGREFVYAMDALGKLDFPFYLAVQNGADLIKMPEREHLHSFYFDESVVLAVEEIFKEKRGDFLLYAGYEQGDFCYYRPHKMALEITENLANMQRRSAVPWRAVESFRIGTQKKFPMIKAIGYEEDFLDVESKLLHNYLLECVIIKDPKSKNYHYLLITDHKASKQEAVSYFLQHYALPRPLIVGGDDNNDRAALELGDIRIVMEPAPASLKMIADIIAPPSAQGGTIKGLNEAIERSQQKGFKQRWA